MTGYSLNELLGKTPKLFQGERTNRATLARLKATIVRGDAFHGATTNYRKNGTAYPVEWNISSIRDERGDITHYISIQKDLSHLKDIVSTLKSTNEHFREFLLDISKPEAINNSEQISDKERQLTQEILENTRLYNPALRSSDNVELFEDEEFFDCDHGCNGMLANDIALTRVNAKDYNARYTTAVDVQELFNRIKETQEKIDLLPYGKNAVTELENIGQNLQDVANDIFYLDDFVNLSSTLTELARQTRALAKNNVTPIIVDTYRALLSDLETWLNQNFVEQSANDIHALDASIISSARQLLLLFK